MYKNIDDFMEDGGVLMSGDPAPDLTIEKMRVLAERASTEEEIADAFAVASNKAFWSEDAEYDFEEGTEEYVQACKATDDWFEVSDKLQDRIINILKSEGLSIPDDGRIEALYPFMERNGYRDGRGWWIKDTD